MDIKRDLNDMDITWEEAEELAADRAGWRQRVANATIWMHDELRSKVYISLQNTRDVGKEVI